MRCQVDDMTEFLKAHEVVDLHCLGLADPINIVAGQVDQHDVLGAVFLRSQ